MQLREHVPKATGHREMRAAEMLRRLEPYLGRIGVTRLADLTGLDRVGIPVWSAVVPDSRDIISVYAGAGATAAEAQVAALMEAAERYVASEPREPASTGAYAELVRRRPTLDPRDVNLALLDGYTPDTPLPWVEGVDLLRGEPVLVPLALAGYYVRPPAGLSCFRVATTTGLGAGASPEEALCHALCEVIERDAWTLAHLLAHRLSLALARGTVGPGRPDPEAAARLRDRYPAIDADSLPSPARELLARLRAAGLRPRLRDLTADTGVASVLCVVEGEIGQGLSAVHLGAAAHPDAAVAAARALAEAAQSRAVDIQGIREDLAPPDVAVDPSRRHVQRASAPDPEGWYLADNLRTVRLDALPCHRHADLMDDVRLLLARLAAVGVPRVVAVDLSLPDLPVAVVRVLVPGLESWIVDRSRLGRRAAAAWRAALTEGTGAAVSGRP
jgi:ribosomal protein S12 methylthiotransferase accessory factor